MADDQKLIKEISKYSDQIGGFAGKFGNLVASCDGVGTKILLAQVAKKHHNRSLDTIGIDCVAMVVNDLLCKGAKPKFFLDYFAADRIREEEFYEILDKWYNPELFEKDSYGVWHPKFKVGTGLIK